MEECENNLSVLKQTLEAIQKDDPTPLKELSNQTIHCATKGDIDNLNIAIIIYSLGKIFSRNDYRTQKGWESFKKMVLISLKSSINDLENKNEEKFRQDFNLIRKAINKISGKLKKYIEEVFEKAEIAKASRIHEHGISAEKTAKMLGISMFDLQNYAGQTGISEVSLNQTINVKTRIKMLEELFSK